MLDRNSDKQLKTQIKFETAYKNNAKYLPVFNPHTRTTEYRYTQYKSKRITATFSGKSADWLEMLGDERGIKAPSVVRHILESCCGMSWEGINSLLAQAGNIKDKHPLEYTFTPIQITDEEKLSLLNKDATPSEFIHS